MRVAWRCLPVLALAFVAMPAQGQDLELKESNLVDSHFQIEMKMQLRGDLLITQEGKEQKLPLKGHANHSYIERVLQEGKFGMVGRAARYYKTAEAEIGVNGNGNKRQLRPDHKLVISQLTNDGVCNYGKLPLSREELEVTQHFESLALPGLLPKDKVAANASWNVPDAVAQTLFNLDGITKQDLQCQLQGVADKIATVEVKGSASGIHAGALVKISVKGNYEFDTEKKRIVSVTWQQTDEREQGPISPKLTLNMDVTTIRTPCDAQTAVNDFALVPIPMAAEPASTVTNLSYQDPKGRYQFVHSRDWHMVARTDQHLVLRLLDRGDFVAQATIVSFPSAEAGKHMSAEEFQKATDETPGWATEEVLETKEVEADKGYWIYRHAASGKLNGLKVLQYSYLVAGPRGDQVVVAFTLTQAQLQKLGTRDMELVRSLRFSGLKEEPTSIENR